MMWAIHPAFHQALGVEAAGGDVFTGPTVQVSLGLDPIDRARPVTPLVYHLFVGSHVLGVPLGRRGQFAADRQARQLALGAQTIMSLDHLVACGLGIEFSGGLILRCLGTKAAYA